MCSLSGDDVIVLHGDVALVRAQMERIASRIKTLNAICGSYRENPKRKDDAVESGDEFGSLLSDFGKLLGDVSKSCIELAEIYKKDKTSDVAQAGYDFF